ncbi:YdcF family protein [Tepidicaulis sp. LMO-SS28]|uniref:YdcF family protein n=1 Tax=Tepidicaulis sp. LMO-SS28 TaxID=3447455 RepID=UPI003EE16E3E
MFFLLSKLAWLVLQPSAALILLGLAGLGLSFTKLRRISRALLAISLCGLLIAAFSPLGHVLTGVLENRVPKAAVTAPPAGIVVLGGAVHMSVSAARGEAALLSGAERLFAAYELAERYPDAPLILSGGSNAVFGAETEIASEAEIMRDVLTRLGVDAGRLEVETTSRNTWENAVNSHALAAEEGSGPWLLVTSAFHMPRALGVFRQAGFEVLPYPVDYRTRGPEDYTKLFYYSAEGLGLTDMAAKEWLGLLAYSLTGKTDALFPGP